MTKNDFSHSAASTALTPYSANALALGGRVMLAAIFILSGLSKLADPAGTTAYIASAGLPLAPVGTWIAIAVELLGGVSLVVGFRPRIVATVLAIFSVAAALSFHNNLADQNQFIHFFKNIAMAGGLLQVVAFGGGAFALTRN